MTERLRLGDIKPILGPPGARGPTRGHVTARLGFIVNDLIRGRPAYCLIWLATRLFTRNRMSRHDDSLSIRRAYTAGEIGDLARRAGLSTLRVTRYPWLSRLAVVGRKR